MGLPTHFLAVCFLRAIVAGKLKRFYTSCDEADGSKLKMMLCGVIMTFEQMLSNQQSVVISYYNESHWFTLKTLTISFYKNEDVFVVGCLACVWMGDGIDSFVNKKCR